MIINQHSYTTYELTLGLEAITLYRNPSYNKLMDVMLLTQSHHAMYDDKVPTLRIIINTIFLIPE